MAAPCSMRCCFSCASVKPDVGEHNEYRDKEVLLLCRGESLCSEVVELRALFAFDVAPTMEDQLDAEHR
ncbi:hypothetical protein BBBOND_0310530 [Babesia bigemina]|uniref:Uncharacterized protein n=1 Tax=Babesia bigemina TaxID=5866 RepID=A0A061DEE7_BABBI|nr:hypothetical protein BBBOND_0310530 [Babesia bigemina]CDR97150.1 hypothetical protein BBBOND_0310530 [Babesia bigemina]|eukprot:XP_012769336.1 hypothetical protein BBBOND_0310530 [Babesia bigemina]